MQPIKTINSTVYFGSEGYFALTSLLANSDYSGLFVLADTNTAEKCYPVFLAKLPKDKNIRLITIPPGEIHKNIASCEYVWNELSELGADRNSLLINLGGGVVTDMGGFVAACFKRGIDFVNIPTSLLSMVDASIGGKTGVDLGLLKNQIGLFKEGKMVIVDISYLSTLPKEHKHSGLSEMLKHGLIADRDYWNSVSDPGIISSNELTKLVRDSILIKNRIVEEDQFESGLRKSLNFGHTLGHAIESHFLETANPLLHGEAIAIGMIMESYLSHKQLGFDKGDLFEIKSRILRFFKKVDFSQKDIKEIIDLLKFDKKNSHGRVLFVLLESIGKPVMDQQLTNQMILEAFEFYKA